MELGHTNMSDLHKLIYTFNNKSCRKHRVWLDDDIGKYSVVIDISSAIFTNYGAVRAYFDDKFYANVINEHKWEIEKIVRRCGKKFNVSRCTSEFLEAICISLCNRLMKELYVWNSKIHLHTVTELTNKIDSFFSNEYFW